MSDHEKTFPRAIYPLGSYGKAPEPAEEQLWELVEEHMSDSWNVDDEEGENGDGYDISCHICGETYYNMGQDELEMGQGVPVFTPTSDEFGGVRQDEIRHPVAVRWVGDLDG